MISEPASSYQKPTGGIIQTNLQKVQVQGCPAGAHAGYQPDAWHCELNLGLDVRCLNPSGFSDQRHGRHWGGRITTRPRSGMQRHSELIHGLIRADLTKLPWDPYVASRPPRTPPRLHGPLPLLFIVLDHVDCGQDEGHCGANARPSCREKAAPRKLAM